MSEYRDIWSYLKHTDKPVFLYGTGNGADKILDEMSRLGIKASGVFASDDFVRKNRIFRGFPVLSHSRVKELYDDFIVLVSFGSNRPEVLENILKLKSEHELYSVDVPVYGDEIFNFQFYEKHTGEIELAEKLLADEFSKYVYRSIINFKLSGEIQFLLDCQTQRDEAYENILRLNGDEIYADLGAFNGDTVFEFLSHVKSCRKIYAFEPDVKNYSKLVKNTKSVPNIQCFNLCVSDRRGEIRFSSDGGRNGSENKNGVAVPCNSLDGVLNGNGCTFIKFDVEGFEAPAIKGAAETIKKYKPKMLISCYHRSEDIFRIPLLVREIRDDYKISIRHYPYIPAWDTQFYFT